MWMFYHKLQHYRAFWAPLFPLSAVVELIKSVHFSLMWACKRNKSQFGGKMVRIREFRGEACALEPTHSVKTEGTHLQILALCYGVLTVIDNESFFSHLYPCPLLPVTSSSIVLSEGASYVFCTGLLEFTCSQCYIRIPTIQCLCSDEYPSVPSPLK